jgi:hypothetical protein
MTSKAPILLLRSGRALVTTVLAVLVRLLLDPPLADRILLLTLLAAVVFTICIEPSYRG